MGLVSTSGKNIIFGPISCQAGASADKILFMWKVAKFGILVAAVAAVGYLSFFVKFGKMTIYQHMVGITRTQEAKELGDEIGKKVDSTVHGVSSEIGEQTSRLAGAVKGVDLRKDPIKGEESKTVVKREPSQEDREALKKLIRKKISD